ncbi:MAG: hypothetical protein OHK0015_10290 [Chloroflexi bacterium OHK40]
MSFGSWARRLLVGTPFEGVARRIYLAFSPARGVQYERELAAVMRRALRPQHCCIDVGAYRGAVLSEMLALAPGGTHFAFEPAPPQYAYLTRRFPQVHTYRLALSDTSGETSFYYVRSRPTYSGLRKVRYPSAGEQVEELRVPTARLDEVIPSEQPVHFVKVDVEGAEYHVFVGGLELLRRWRPLLVFEHGLTSAWYYQRPSAALYDLLAGEVGYQLWLMRDWLDGRSPLGRDAFVRAVEVDRHYYFLAQ